MNPFKFYWLWNLAETKDYERRWPRWFWMWLLVKCDKANGYNFEYDR